MKNHSRHLHPPLCAIFAPNSGYIARYAPFIWHKSPTNCGIHLSESIFQTRSRTLGAAGREDLDFPIRHAARLLHHRQIFLCVPKRKYAPARMFAGKGAKLNHLPILFPRPGAKTPPPGNLRWISSRNRRFHRRRSKEAARSARCIRSHCFRRIRYRRKRSRPRFRSSRTVTG